MVGWDWYDNRVLEKQRKEASCVVWRRLTVGAQTRIHLTFVPFLPLFCELTFGLSRNPLGLGGNGPILAGRLGRSDCGGLDGLGFAEGCLRILLRRHVELHFAGDGVPRRHREETGM